MICEKCGRVVTVAKTNVKGQAVCECGAVLPHSRVKVTVDNLSAEIVVTPALPYCLSDYFKGSADPFKL